MIEPNQFIHEAAKFGFGLYTGVPCSYLTPFINFVSDSDDLRYIGAANEGDAVAIAAGAEIGGQRCIVMMQNSGIGNALNPLTSLAYPFRIPMLLIITLRGEPGGPADEPQHELMGAITNSLLDLMEIPWSYFPDDDKQISECLQRAVNHMDTQQRPYALVMRKGSVSPYELQSPATAKSMLRQPAVNAVASHRRVDMLQALHKVTGPDDLIIATTGYTGRELFALGDSPNQLYFVGSMGCASSFGLGLALAQPSRRVIVVDGDGAALMRLGALTTVGYERPENLIHVLLDNGIHESTGGQFTVSHSVDFCAVAAGCGYPQTTSVSEPEALASLIAMGSSGMHFIHVPIIPGVADKLPRPDLPPNAIATRLRMLLRNSA
jgi:phosphonopyruvate decarboxylase